MKIRIQDHPDCEILDHKNTTGATLAAGTKVRIGGRLYVLPSDIRNGETGSAYGLGRFKFVKATGYTLSRGDQFTWDGAKAVKWDGTNATPPDGVITDDAASNDTVCYGNLGLGVGRRSFAKAHVVTAGEDTANAATIDTGFGADPSFLQVQIRSATGVHRSPQGIVSFGTAGNLGKITVNDTGLAVNEVIEIFALA